MLYYCHAEEYPYQLLCCALSPAFGLVLLWRCRPRRKQARIDTNNTLFCSHACKCLDPALLHQCWIVPCCTKWAGQVTGIKEEDFLVLALECFPVAAPTGQNTRSAASVLSVCTARHTRTPFHAEVREPTNAHYLHRMYDVRGGRGELSFHRPQPTRNASSFCACPLERTRAGTTCGSVRLSTGHRQRKCHLSRPPKTKIPPRRQELRQIRAVYPRPGRGGVEELPQARAPIRPLRRTYEHPTPRHRIFAEEQRRQSRHYSLTFC